MKKQSQDWYFISAGEYSGDLLAANFVISMRELNPTLEPFGVVGEHMRAARVDPVLDMSRFSMMGIADVVRQLGALRILEKQLLARIDERRPKFAVLVDFPGLHFRLAEQLRLRDIPVIQYVAPKVWAWGEKRVENLRRDFELVLGVLPFEEKFFLDAGVNYKFIGSPHKDRTSKVMVNRATLGLAEDGKVVGMLPGSRKTELSHILPKMIEVKHRLAADGDNIHFIMPLANNLSEDALAGVLPNGVKLERDGETLSFAGIQVVRGMSLEVMAVSDLAIVASGTATLECALLGTPMVVMYIMDSTTFDIARKAVRVPYISLVNLIAGRELVKEYIQHFSVDDVAQSAKALFQDENRNRIMREFDVIRDYLPGDASHSAAKELHKLLQDRGIVET